MKRFLFSILLLASVIGPMTCASSGGNDHLSPTEPPSTKMTTIVPSTTTVTSTVSPITNATTPSTTTTTKPPITTTAHSTTTSTTTTVLPTSPSTTKPTTPTPTHPSTTPAPPSDRKFEAFSFIGGFALAIGLVAIGFLAWKLYISRRENVYHTL